MKRNENTMLVRDLSQEKEQFLIHSFLWIYENGCNLNAETELGQIANDIIEEVTGMMWNYEESMAVVKEELERG